MLAIVLSISVILYSEVKIISNIGNSVSAFYSAQTGAEEVLYFDRKVIPNGGNRGICSICATCDSGDCMSCSASTSILEGGGTGCDAQNCTNCQIKYNSSFNDRTYFINVIVTPDNEPGVYIFNIKSKGGYKDSFRSLELNSVSE